jgi:hypothetical protein
VPGTSWNIDFNTWSQIAARIASFLNLGSALRRAGVNPTRQLYQFLHHGSYLRKTMLEKLYIADIPPYLRTGGFFTSLEKSDDNSTIELPMGVTKIDTTIASASALRDLLISLRFWMVEDVPDTLTEYVVYSQDGDIYNVVFEFAADMPYLSLLWGVRTAKTAQKKLSCAVLTGRVQVLVYLHASIGCAFSERHVITAARVGNAASLKYVCDHGAYASNYACIEAAGNGTLACLQYLHVSGAQLEAASCEAAAKGGHLACLQYLHSCGCPWGAVTTASAAWSGHLDCLKYAKEHGCGWDSTTCSAAARQGSASCLVYAHENGCPWDSTTSAGAAAGGHLECLQYLHKHGCPWSASTCASAAQGGHLSCLRYAHENGCEWDRSTGSAAAEGGHVECLRYALDNGCGARSTQIMRAAARGGRLACLQLAHERGLRWDDQCCTPAARRNYLDCFEYLLQHGCPFVPSKMLRATPAAKAMLDDYLRSKGRPLDLRTFRRALQDQSEDSPGVAYYRTAYPEDSPMHRLMFMFDCGALTATQVFDMAVTDRAVDSAPLLRHIVETKKLAERAWRGPPNLRKLANLVVRIGDPDSVAIAIAESDPSLCSRWTFTVCMRGFLSAAKLLHERGCAFPASCTREVAWSGRADLLQLLHERGCPWHDEVTFVAAARGNLACLQYAHKQGCPWTAMPLAVSGQTMGWYKNILQCVQYYVEHGGPVSPETLAAWREVSGRC